MGGQESVIVVVPHWHRVSSPGAELVAAPAPPSKNLCGFSASTAVRTLRFSLKRPEREILRFLRLPLLLPEPSCWFSRVSQGLGGAAAAKRGSGESLAGSSSRGESGVVMVSDSLDFFLVVRDFHQALEELPLAVGPPEGAEVVAVLSAIACRWKAPSPVP